MGGRTSEDVAGVVYDRYPLMVENVESLAEKLYCVALVEPDSLRQPQVHVDGSFLAETVTANHIDPRSNSPARGVGLS